MVDVHDVAEVAASVLARRRSHAGATYELVGPGRFTAHDLARIIAEVTGARWRRADRPRCLPQGGARRREPRRVSLPGAACCGRSVRGTAVTTSSVTRRPDVAARPRADDLRAVRTPRARGLPRSSTCLRGTHVTGDRPRPLPRDPGPLPDRRRRGHGAGGGRQPGRHGRRDLLLGLPRPAAHRLLPRHRARKLRAAQERRRRSASTSWPPTRNRCAARSRRAPEGKFDGVAWRPGPLGSPILEDAVSWIECTFEEVREAGDHYIVLGRVHHLAVERSTLPLLFFQGGYGRFSPGSFIAAPDPELIQAARLAETVRVRGREPQHRVRRQRQRPRQDPQRRRAGARGQRGSSGRAVPLGHRQPIIPPLGAVSWSSSTPDEVDDWLGRAPEGRPRPPGALRELLEKVRERGYSLLAAEPDADGTPRAGAVRVREVRPPASPRTGRPAGDGGAGRPVLSRPRAGRAYDVASIVVLDPDTVEACHRWPCG